MAARYYPTNAPRSGATTLTGAGNVADEFTFPVTCTAIVENNTGAAIEAHAAKGAPGAATAGSFAIPAGAEWVSEDTVDFVAIYGTAGTTVNGVAAGGLVIFGVA